MASLAAAPPGIGNRKELELKEWMPEGFAWLYPVVVALASLAGALAAYWLLLLVLRKAAARSRARADDMLLQCLARPGRWLLVSLVVVALLPLFAGYPVLAAAARRIFGLVIPALVGWFVIALLRAFRDIVQDRADISVADNLRARRKRTRADILYRIAASAVLLVSFCMMLMSIPSVRNIGLTLIASAGIVGIAVGAAAQPALKNLIAGIQMAFSEPIRIDDVVVIDGELGNIEQIRLTYVVVRLWDERRLIVPVSRFLDSSFQNWTRETSRILGTAFLHVDQSADVPRIRAKLEEVVKANPNWDGRVLALQVTEVHPTHMELRALVSGADGARAFDLRCEVREALMRFLAEEMPEALPRRREELTDVHVPRLEQGLEEAELRAEEEGVA